MRLLFDLADHYNFLNNCVEEKPTAIRLGTYGLYAGIMPDGRDSRDWGAKYRSETRELLEKIKTTDAKVKILVGQYEHKSCKGKSVVCSDCERKYVLDLVRLMNHAEAFSGFKWRISTGIHLKCAIFTYPESNPSAIRGQVGGRNLTDSQWADVSVELDKMSCIRVQEKFDELWEDALILNADRIGRIMEEQQIAQSTIDKIMSMA